MRLSRQELDLLRGVLKLCTANVSVDGRSKGTAFHIGDSLLLTCEHVVRGRTEVEVRPHRRPPRRAVVLERHAGFDLALLEAERLDDEDPLPSVLLDPEPGDAPGALFEAQVDGGHLFLSGYPRDEFGEQPSLEVLDLAGHGGWASDGTLSKLQLEAGQRITPGLSGGPVVSVERGAVVAVTRWSHDDRAAEGGGAVPIGRALEAFEQVKPLAAAPPLSVRKWRDALGPVHWTETGHVWDVRTKLDLYLRRAAPRVWSIRTDAEGVQEEVVTADRLGDDVSEAMFRWAQRMRLTEAEEVELLGRLLAKALLPPAVEKQFAMLADADEIQIRLHVDAASDLADVPWELATVPGREGYLATDQRYRFSRVVKDMEAGAPARGPVSAPAHVDVLATVGLPESWKGPTVHSEQGSYSWPSLEEIWAELSGSITKRGQFGLTPLRDPQLSTLEGALEGRQYQVLHYVGLGRTDVRGRAQLSVVEQGNQFRDVSRVVQRAKTAGVRLLVLEFLMPPVGKPVVPVTPRSLGPTLGGSLEAVIFTRFPVHPLQCQRFNDRLYAQLAAGDTVEGAVQQARRVLNDDEVLDEAAGFGWFTVMTTGRTDIRLVQRGAAEERPGPGSADPEYRDAHPSPTPGPARERRRDSFGGLP